MFALIIGFDQILEKNRVSKCTFAGHSLGGYLACHYMDKRPSKVRDLYLLSPGGVNQFTENDKEAIFERINNMSLPFQKLFSNVADNIFEKKVNFIKTHMRYLNIKILIIFGDFIKYQIIRYKNLIILIIINIMYYLN